MCHNTSPFSVTPRGDADATIRVDANGTVSCASLSIVNSVSTTSSVALSSSPVDGAVIVDGSIEASGQIMANGQFSLNVGTNAGGLTFDTASLTITRNVSNGANEYDLVCINPLTNTFLNIYGSQTSVVGVNSDPTTAPIASVKSDGLYATTYRGGISFTML